MTREEKITDLQRQIDELKELPNGVWYKSIYGSIVKKTGIEDGFGYSSSGRWCECGWIWKNKYWQPATSEEIEEAIKKRWNETNPEGLDFDCLIFPNKKTTTGYHYNLDEDAMCLDGQYFYDNGKFATPIKKKKIRMKDLKYGQVAKFDNHRVTKMSFGFIDIDSFIYIWDRCEESEVEIITDPITITFNK